MNIQRFTATGFNPNNRCAEVAADDHGAWVLHDDVADMQRDAERYRWIKSQGLLKVAAMTSLHPGESRIYGDFTYCVPGTFGELGTAIDAAMKGAND